MGRETDFSVKGEGKLYQEGWSVDLEMVTLGTVKLDGRLEQKANRSGQPLIAAFLHSSEIDLSTYFQKPDKSDQDRGKGSESSEKKEKEDNKELTPEQQMARTDELLANQIFPKKRLLSMDVKLDLHVEKLNIGQGSVSDIKLSATIEDGKLSDAPFQAFIAGESFVGNAKIDLTGDEPLTHFELTSDGLNLPNLYEEFGLGNAPDIKAEHLTFKVSLKGRALLDLENKSIQLNDFQFGDWSPVAEEKKEDVAEDMQEENKQDEGKLHDLFSPELAAKFMGTLYIQVDEVLSGDDKLGSGLLNAKLKNSRYSLDNLRLDIPGGSVFIQGSLKPEVGKITADLAMQIENLDYGVLVRRTKPDSDLKGKINLSFDIQSEAETPFQLKKHVGGKLRFGVIPEEYKAGAIDLWAVNIVTVALPALLKGTPSEVNCLAGHFILEDGIMHPNVFLLDTSKVRVQGKGEVNFKTDAIDFNLHPTPKKAHFFSLATPITVSGTITDYHIGITAGAVLGTIFQLTTSVLTVPYHWLFTDNLEADGSKACSEAMAWAQENESIKMDVQNTGDKYDE